MSDDSQPGGRRFRTAVRRGEDDDEQRSAFIDALLARRRATDTGKIAEGDLLILRDLARNPA